MTFTDHGSLMLIQGNERKYSVQESYIFFLSITEQNQVKLRIFIEVSVSNT